MVIQRFKLNIIYCITVQLNHAQKCAISLVSTHHLSIAALVYCIDFYLFEWCILFHVEHILLLQDFCKAVATCLHFFVLSVFGWMLCEGILLYILLIRVFDGVRGRLWKIFNLIGWGKLDIFTYLFFENFRKFILGYIHSRCSFVNCFYIMGCYSRRWLWHGLVLLA